MAERDRLNVWHAERRVGLLWRDGLDRIGFVYDPTWRNKGFRIGRTLPLRAEPFEPATGSAHAWFANLLPEGAARERIVRQLGVADDDFALLRAIGGDCAGALSLLGEDRLPAEESSARALDDRQLEQMIRQRGQGLGFGGVGDGEPAPRLSLAGAQAKCTVLIREGDFYLPLGSTASSHILKFELPEWRNVPVFEVFLNRLAAAVGLPVPETRLSERHGQRFLVVARYDRMPDKSGKANCTRLHQEDFCQLEGLRPTRKYQADDGPGFVQCAAHVRSRSELPAIDLRNLLRWQIFNWLAGNSDGHAKNLALVQVEPNAERWRLRLSTTWSAPAPGRRWIDDLPCPLAARQTRAGYPGRTGTCWRVMRACGRHSCAGKLSRWRTQSRSNCLPCARRSKANTAICRCSRSPKK